MARPSFTKRLASSLNPRPDYQTKPLAFAWRSHKAFILATAGIGFFTDLFLYALIVPILPHILEDRVHLSHDKIQSISSAMLAAFAASAVVASPIAGFVADRTTSRQIPFLFGLSCLMVSTVLLFTGTTIPVLMVARIGQGASSGFVWTVGLALCIDTVGPKNLGKIIGTLFSFLSVGALFAPVVGGALYERAGMLAVGILSMSLLVIDFFMRLLVIEKKIAARYNEADPDYSSSPASESDAEDPAQQEANEDSPLLRKQSDPAAFFIPPSIPSWYHKLPIAYPVFKSPSLITAFTSTFIQAMILGSFDATVPTHASDMFDYDSLKTGLLFVPLSLTNLIIGPLAGWWVDRHGSKVVAVIGYTFMAPCLILLRIPVAEPQPQMPILYGALLGLCGIGLAMIDAPAIVEAGAVVDRYHRRNPGFFGEQGPYAQLYGLNSMLFSLGLTVGPELAGELKRKIGYGNMNLVVAAISAVNAVVCFIWMGGKPRIWKRRDE